MDCRISINASRAIVFSALTLARKKGPEFAEWACGESPN
jgi:hypothetical protein